MPTVWDALYQQGKIWGTTCSLLDCLLFNEWPSATVVHDFGIASARHYAAIRYSIFFDDKPEWSLFTEEEISAAVDAEMTKRVLELNHALQHGRRLTAFVQKYAPDTLAHVVFDTGMDDLAEMLERGRESKGR